VTHRDSLVRFAGSPLFLESLRATVAPGILCVSGEAQAGSGAIWFNRPLVTLRSPLVRSAPLGYQPLARAARNESRGSCESLARSSNDPESALLYRTVF
jgi:hypothetical protein